MDTSTSGEVVPPRWKAAIDRYRARFQHQHGWDVELTCPRCGTSAVPQYDGWTPSRAMALGSKPIIYANLSCRRCATDLRAAAGEKLVEMFSDVSIPPHNKRLIVALVAYTAISLAIVVGASMFLKGAVAVKWLPLALMPLWLMHHLSRWFGASVHSTRQQCACGNPLYKFMGMLGRSYCYRCSTCGNLLRLRD